MKNSISLAQFGHSIARFFHRYHVVLYSLTIVIGVSIAVFFLNNLISLSNTTDSNAAPKLLQFDATTIKQINKFTTSDKSDASFSLPAGRVNPFVE